MLELALAPVVALLSAAPAASLIAARSREERVAAAATSASTFAPALALRLAFEAPGLLANPLYKLAALATTAAATALILSTLSRPEVRRVAAVAAASTLPASATTLASLTVSTFLVPAMSLTISAMLAAALLQRG
ncbi:MAG: hypothetical protein QXW41_07445 [Fervidicoccaceae archaeon]